MLPKDEGACPCCCPELLSYSSRTTGLVYLALDVLVETPDQ
jgi:hypothetical protein